MAEIKQFPTAPTSKALRALSFWHQVVVRGLQHTPHDLSARQNGILLSVYLEQGPHSIKSLSENLSISKPAVCRAVDSLEQLKFVRRVRDKEDKRNVLIQRTVKGSVYLSDFAELILSVSKEVA